MIFVTSDIHGYPLERFLARLEKAGFGPDDRLYVIGDVIDRNGDGGVAMLRWIMAQPNVTLLRGNHENMLLDCSFLFSTEPQFSGYENLSEQQECSLLLWHRNGGIVTIQNLMKLQEEDPATVPALLDYIRATPLYAEVSVPMMRFVLVHGGLDRFRPDRPLEDYTADELVWTRPALTDRYWDDRLVILGHTPTRYYGEPDRMLVTPTWIDIDTGAAAGGSPMILRLEDMYPFYEE